MDLQDMFYVIGIIVMSLVLLLLIALVIAVFVIRAKVNAIHDTIDQKLRIFTSAADKGKDTVGKVKKLVRRK